MDQDISDKVRDWQKEPWRCELHNRYAVKERQGNEDIYGCPECLEYIDKAWDEWKEWKEGCERDMKNDDVWTDPSGTELVKVQDSGSRSEYATGAQRDNHVGKGRFDLIPPDAMFRVARWFEAGAEKYEPRNWEKGIPISRCIDACIRHAFKYLAGWNDEDHLAAVIWNAMAIMYYEQKKPELQDLPEWEGRKSKWVYKGEDK